jgi:hypothetical protein
MMEDIKNAIEFAIAAFKAEYGEDAKFEEGDEVVFQFNNCTLIMGIEDNTLKEKFIGGQPIKVDYALKIYEGEEKEDE